MAAYGFCSNCGQRIKQNNWISGWYHTGSPPGWPMKSYDHLATPPEPVTPHDGGA